MKESKTTAPNTNNKMYMIIGALFWIAIFLFIFRSCSAKKEVVDVDISKNITNAKDVATKPTEEASEDKPLQALTNDEKTYIDNVRMVVLKYQEGFLSFSACNKKAERDGSLINDKEWQRDLVKSIVIIKSCSEEVSRVSAPAKFKDIHKKLTSAAQKYAESMGVYTKAIDGLNLDMLNQSTKIMADGNEHMKDVLNWLDAQSSTDEKTITEDTLNLIKEKNNIENEQKNGIEKTEYLDKINEIVDRYKINYQQFIELTGKVAKDSSIIRNKTWREECANAIVQIKKCNILANELNAPDSLKELDINLKLGAKHYETAMDLYAKGIDEFDSSMIISCGKELDDGNRYMSFVLENLESYN